MPPKTITALVYMSGILVAGYIALIALTMYFASVQTGYAASVRTLESDVAVLETEYYATLSRISDADVALAGYRTPDKVDYVRVGGAPTLTRADQ